MEVRAQAPRSRRRAPLVRQLGELAVAISRLRLSDALDDARRDRDSGGADVRLAERLRLVEGVLDRARSEERLERRTDELVAADGAEAVWRRGVPGTPAESVR